MVKQAMVLGRINVAYMLEINFLGLSSFSIILFSFFFSNLGVTGGGRSQDVSPVASL